LLTQIGRYGHMMKVAIDKACVYVTAHFKVEGSVLAQTVRASLNAVKTRLEVESKDPAERVAGVIRNAENGCFVMQALLNPVPVSSSVTLNGSGLDLKAYPPPQAAKPS
jgi:organic hydroperoxide reductase OsmC/OhrA